MEALIGLMLLLAFLGTLDFGKLFKHSQNYSAPVVRDTDRETASVLK